MEIKFTAIIFLVCLSVSLTIVNISSIRSFSFGGYMQNSRQRTDEPESLGMWIRPPCNLLHQMNDKELFWRASFSPRIEEYPFPRVNKIAFLFLTKGPLPLAPLWEKFFKGHQDLYSIYIHSLPTYQLQFASSSPFFRRKIPSQNVTWGDINMVDAERRLLANALLDVSNERFVLLSETSIPIFNFSVIYKYIMESNHAFTCSVDDERPEGRGRYSQQMAPTLKVSEWRKGDQWFEVDRESAVSLIADVKYYPLFKEFCKPSCYPDEHYFATFLHIEAGNRLANRSITFVDWTRGGWHPASFGASDVSEEFFAQINSDDGHCSYNGNSISRCFLFARKFAPSALKPLLNLSHVFGY